MKRLLLLMILPMGVLALQPFGEAHSGPAPGDSPASAAACADPDGSALIASLDAAPLTEMGSVAAAAKCYMVGITIFADGCGCSDLYVLRYLCYSPDRGWTYKNYWYCNGDPCPCDDSFYTPQCTEMSPYNPCRSRGSNEGINFDVQFDAYGRVVYCNNVQNSVKINWVELTMNVQSATEPLDCQGTEMNKDPDGERTDIYRVNGQTPFPLGVGSGWRGSIVFWDELTFNKTSGDERLLIWDLATVYKEVRVLTTCGENYWTWTPPCFHQWASGWSMQTEKGWTDGDWAVAIQRAPGGT